MAWQTRYTDEAGTDMELDFNKYSDGLIPAVVQDAKTRTVLMLGFMNEAAYEKTVKTGRVTFFSRSRQSLWTKGETSGNLLEVSEVITDCDSDTILIKATPSGPICHTGAYTCFGEKNESAYFLFELEEIIKDRKIHPVEGSYTSKLFAAGLNRIVQKVGEEAVELVIEGINSDDNAFTDETADFLYHFLVLLSEKNIALSEIFNKLRSRSQTDQRCVSAS
ncbi:bifunctional phosphoribosyl-AMP cyclohydrolase/phosphoribosyl-ATP diphosphatase HisIE [Leptolyngbya sp. 7M]|uniref:bifunctional phosphoribosyl-AMP cyclohydrolase/phosphoribosyl-ATP diphosphatase HisIE n=1 Tax=Leptolyngbya sp. 7M TaxID=2812896 RepID=UPI001B8C8943|nr:bifunctional phosphoribosyl-AMP cyclohydrolase/phosphoribosyl-ATP diphosphatase HisIE [Leptolyngbya sp. 7M]QYO65323.1 bifunctional phosphoribosyl-AMP cyclohydrolase/phosphoribosyl-ATP diphosphatase HisIE [Leptolyngbya sp. 7M]